MENTPAPSSPSPLGSKTKWLILAVILMFAAYTAALAYQNQRISKLEQASRIETAEEPTDAEAISPVCERDITGMAVSGGTGVEIISVTGDDMEIEGYPGPFHLCENATIHDVVTGGTLGKDAIKPGAKIWFETTEANYIKKVRVVSR